MNKEDIASLNIGDKIRVIGNALGSHTVSIGSEATIKYINLHPISKRPVLVDERNAIFDDSGFKFSWLHHTDFELIEPDILPRDQVAQLFGNYPELVHALNTIRQYIPLNASCEGLYQDLLSAIAGVVQPKTKPR